MIISFWYISTADQILDHQSAQAEAAGFIIDEVVVDMVSQVGVNENPT